MGNRASEYPLSNAFPGGLISTQVGVKEFKELRLRFISFAQCLRDRALFETFLKFQCHFYSARNACIASAVLATAIPSVRPSVCPSVRHTPVLCQNDGT